LPQASDTLGLQDATFSIVKCPKYIYTCAKEIQPLFQRNSPNLLQVKVLHMDNYCRVVN